MSKVLTSLPKGERIGIAFEAARREILAHLALQRDGRHLLIQNQFTVGLNVQIERLGDHARDGNAGDYSGVEAPFGCRTIHRQYSLRCAFSRLKESSRKSGRPCPR